MSNLHSIFSNNINQVRYNQSWRRKTELKTALLHLKNLCQQGLE